MKHIPKKEAKQESDFIIQLSNSAEKSLEKIPFSDFILIDKEINHSLQSSNPSIKKITVQTNCIPHSVLNVCYPTL